MTSTTAPTLPVRPSVASPPAGVDFLAQDRYPQSTYVGRVRAFFSVIDPRTLLTTDTQLQQALKTIADYKAGKRDGVTQEQIWAAKKTRDSVLHPDTGQPIFAPFRFSAFVPINVPLVVGMLSSTTPAATAFWQWANQSYNVAVNYANRNIGGKQMSTQAIAASYTAAVLSSCGLALGLGKVANNLNKRPNPGFGIRVFSGAVPFFAVASAGVLNVGLMRLSEAREGVPVKDEFGVEHGISVKAGVKSLTEVALTRVAMPAPILLFPPILMSLYDRTPIAKARPHWRPFVQVPVITACLWLALPLAIGLFPQMSSIKAEDMEEQFKGRKDKNGNVITTFYFNKGL